MAAVDCGVEIVGGDEFEFAVGGGEQVLEAGGFEEPEQWLAAPQAKPWNYRQVVFMTRPVRAPSASAVPI